MVSIEPTDEEEAIFQKIAEYIKNSREQMQKDKELENDFKNMTYSEWLEEIGADPERVEEEQKKKRFKRS